MAVENTHLVLDALQRAAATPGGLTLHGTSTSQGLFGRSAIAKRAANRCVADGLLAGPTYSGNGKSTSRRFTISDKGRRFLLAEIGPIRVLKQLLVALETPNNQLQQVAATSSAIAETLEAIKRDTAATLEQFTARTNGRCSAPDNLLAALTEWQSQRNGQDCPLPELFRLMQNHTPSLTPGQFHDRLRTYQGRGHIYLHPWTGPLYDLPEPVYALLSGHEIAYYASIRKDG